VVVPQQQQQGQHTHATNAAAATTATATEEEDAGRGAGAVKLRFKHVALVVALLLFVGATLFVIANPFNWGVRKSARFSFRRFTRIERGMTVEQAIVLLGQPLHVVNGIEPPLCPSPSTCRNFVFADEAKPWVVAYKKAWVIVDQNGRVVNTLLYEEP
jgi:hypothetical protein